jgi:7-cyano-7-deazaguanine synthase
MSKKAVILLSGGLDSATVLALAKSEGYTRVANAIGVEQHKIAHIDLRLFGGSALTDVMDVPKASCVEDIGEDIPITYVPARNTIFLSFALAWAEVLRAYDIFIGVNAVDYSGYPDCRPEFISAYETMANYATAYGVEAKQRISIRTPLIDKTKAEIIRLGRSLGVDYALTLSCYDPLPDGTPCGVCHSCLLRAKGFAEAV